MSFKKKNHIRINKNFELFFGKSVLKNALKNKSKKFKNSNSLSRIFSNLKFSINSIEEFIHLNKILKKVKKPLELKTENIIYQFSKNIAEYKKSIKNEFEKKSSLF